VVERIETFSGARNHCEGSVLLVVGGHVKMSIAESVNGLRKAANVSEFALLYFLVLSPFFVKADQKIKKISCDIFFTGIGLDIHVDIHVCMYNVYLYLSIRPILFINIV
jgi:hypothetical protein